MISIVVCSREKDLLEKLKENIAATIGVPFEVVSVDNSQKKYGICEAYNIGASQSKYKYLCFMHEDILFRTDNWGTIVDNLLSDPSIGLIGIAGGVVKTKTPSPWYVESGDYSRMRILQHRWDGQKVLDYSNPYNAVLSEVVMVDGVWFCCRKEVWQENKFDSATFKEFHFYDLDFSMQLFQKGYRVCVIYSILIEHFSQGSMNQSWINNAIKFSKKWAGKLPATVITLHPDKMRKLEFSSCKYFLTILMNHNIRDRYFFKYACAYLFSNPNGHTLKKRLKNYIRNHTPFLKNSLGSISS